MPNERLTALCYKNDSSWGRMKNKNERKLAHNKRPYIGPRVTVLDSESDEAKKLAGALAGGPPLNCEEDVTALRSSKTKKKLPRSV